MWRMAPKTCSMRAPGVAIRRLRCFCVSEIALLALPLRRIYTQPASGCQLRFALDTRVTAVGEDITDCCLEMKTVMAT
jgi:hypothetical protein